MKKLYVGNLAYETTTPTLESLFAEFGQVSSVKIITDPYNGQSRGFAFVEFEDGAQADAAMEALNGQTVDGKQIRVNEARPQSSREGGGGGAGRSSFGDRSSGGGGQRYNRE